VLLVTGPVTTRMREALERAYAAMSEPRLVAALGDCAFGCGVLGDPGEIAGRREDVLPVDIRIPGCPPDPETIARHLAAVARPDGRRPGPS
jgi:Ni,Fe-hydrogenase III small subunit